MKNPHKRCFLNSRGKWLSGMSVAVDNVMRSEGEADDFSLDKARALAAQLGSSLDLLAWISKGSQ